MIDDRDQLDDAASVFGTKLPQPPTLEQQNWGALISIVVIVSMVVIGAFYAWGKRIAEEPGYRAQVEGGLVTE